MTHPNPSPVSLEAEAEEERLLALAGYEVLDTPAEQGWDDIVLLATQICAVPVALISFVDRDRQWFKARIGFDPCETPLNESVCAHALGRRDLLVVPDLRLDARTRHNPLVTGEPHLRFYAGAPLTTPEGYTLGTLCVIDREPRPDGLTEAQADGLRALANQVMAQLELRRSLVRRRADEVRNRQILDSAIDHAIVSLDPAGCVTAWNRGAETLFGWSEAEMLGRPAALFFRGEDRGDEALEREMRHAAILGLAGSERRLRRRDGDAFVAASETMPLRDATGAHVGYLMILRDRSVQRRREDRLALLAKASAALISTDDPEGVLRPILEAGAETLGFDMSFTYNVEPDRGHMTLAHSVGLTPDLRDALQRVPTHVPLCGLVAETGQPLILSHLTGTTEPRFASARELGVRAYAGYPIRSHDQVRGLVSFASRATDSFDTETLGFFETLAFLVSVARERVDAEAELRAGKERLGLAAEMGDVGVFDLDLETFELLWDDRVRAAFGVAPGGPITQDAKLAAIHPDDRDAFNRHVAAAIEGADFDLQFRSIGIEDRVVRWVAGKGRVIAKPDGRRRFIGAVRDVTERVAAEDQRRVLNAELAHRLKNTLSVVAAVTGQTLRTAPDLQTARRTLGERIGTLSRAHDVLLTGRRDAGAIGAVVTSALAGHDDGKRVVASGPDVLIGPNAALMLSLILHELATNAMKYGSLSVPSGQVNLTWAADFDDATRHPTLTLDWVETGGPPVVKPTHRSFGTRLIEMGLGGASKSEVCLDYDPCGLRCRMVASMADLQRDGI